MSVTESDVLHVAALARLGVEAERVPKLVAELNGILEHMEVLMQVNLERVEPVAGVGRSEGMPLRADEGPPVALERPLATFAPEIREGFLLVPRLATHGDAAGMDLEIDADVDAEIEEDA